MQSRHGIAAQVSNDALADVNRVVIDPGYNSASGRSVRIIGFSMLADEIITRGHPRTRNLQVWFPDDEFEEIASFAD
jgi:hypothetical protein